MAPFEPLQATACNFGLSDSSLFVEMKIEVAQDGMYSINFEEKNTGACRVRLRSWFWPFGEELCSKTNVGLVGVYSRALIMLVAI